ncbi:hypothetical protein [Roseisolibacter agri]|uniref:Signal transduction histidine kinase dimerisation/phosphoacceptor domain-containing protein n=1 Tax=Roseisolibacter agri TaxID=2014610 RepID=A0AA37QI79_9BACT|nr:hypothetical protein [Roseisolibacter agri]GLC26258.1 hypothetical protein rosag_27710 [Roseisolibacter agri]
MGHAAHEVNNALNGAVVNVEVVRIRARPGADGGGAAPFAESAAGELERAAALVGALVGLSRGARQAGDGPVDVGAVLHQVVTLLAPALAHGRLALTVEPGVRHAATGAPLTGVRLAVASALFAAAGARDPATGAGRSGGVPSGGAAEVVGADPADEPDRSLRCTLRLDPTAELRLDAGDGPGTTTGPGGRPPLALPDEEDLEALAAVGIHVVRDGDAVVIRFPPTGTAA